MTDQQPQPPNRAQRRAAEQARKRRVRKGQRAFNRQQLENEKQA